jgi:hypothetical protein
MKSCQGCKHLAPEKSCVVDNGPVERIQYAGHVDYISRGGRIFGRSLEEARQPGGVCGPDAAKWRPTLMWRLFHQ